jgi:hypothetical protein
MRKRTPLLLLTLAVLVVACGADTVDDTTTTQPTTTTTQPTTTTTGPTTTSTVPSVGGVFDWVDRSASLDLGDGWTVAHCEGEAPLVCVSRDGDLVGVLELFIADPLTYTAFDPAADDETNLRAIGAHFVDAFQTDRASGCGADYVVEALEPRTIEMGGNPALAYGFRGTLGDGTASEYNLQYATLSHGRLIFLVGAAYDDGGCPGKDDMVSFDSATLEAFQPHLEAMLEASSLPGGDLETGLALPEGFNFVWILSMDDDGLVVDPARVLSGEEAQLQAVADGVIAEGEDLPNDYYIHNPTEDAIPVRMADDVKWTVIAPGEDGTLAAQETDREAIAAILAGGDTGEIYGLVPEFMPFDLLVIGGEVVELNQRYFP